MFAPSNAAMKAFKGPKDENFILNHMGELWPLIVYNHFVKKSLGKNAFKYAIASFSEAVMSQLSIFRENNVLG